jgi:hypothetical protein
MGVASWIGLSGVWMTKNTAAQDATRTTNVISDDLRVDPIRDADDHSAGMIIDHNAALITASLVSQYH